MIATNPIYDALLRARQITSSDAHLKAKQHVSYRVDRRLRTESGLIMTSELTEDFLRKELSDEKMEALYKQGYLDAGLDFSQRPGLERIGRLRLNCRYAYERTALNIAIRLHASRIFRLSEFEIGDYIENTIMQPHRGLDLIVAPMGMAKSSLRAAILQELNERFGFTITSYEDPIELILTPVKGSIEQIEVGSDVATFHESEYTLRRTDTDVCSYGELRDLLTRRAALAAAKSMNVYATSHASSAIEAIDDYIESFPAAEQSEIRVGLAQALHSVIVLRAVPRGRGRELSSEKLNGRQNVRIVSEILHVTDAVRTLIRKGETHRLRTQQMGPDREQGSRTLESHFAQLVAAGEIDADDPLVRREIRNRSNFESELQNFRGRR